MNEYNNAIGVDERNLQEVTHVVGQIEKLRLNIDAKIQNKKLPETQVMEVLADAMEAVDETTRIHSKNSLWGQLYDDIRKKRIPDDLVEKIARWQQETLNWVDHMESRRLIHILQEEVRRQAELLERLGNNYNVLKGWVPEINKEKISYAIETDHSLGVTSRKRDRQIIVSLTSYPDRMYDIKYALYSLLHQSLKPDQIILWLAEEQFPNREGDIAPSLLAMRESGLTIRWCEDIKSYKKLIPALELYPEDIIVTADDDIYYPENWLEQLYNSYRENPDCIHCHRAHRVRISGGKIAPYYTWEQKIEMEEASYDAFPTGCGGILYPPHSLYKDITNKELFMSLSPSADDIWFWAMSILNGTKIRILKNGIKDTMVVNWAREIGLCEEGTLYKVNGTRQGNDAFLQNVSVQYPELLEILKSKQAIDRKGWDGSAQYWEQRYAEGGASGAGSYNNLADFKARVLNRFVHEHSIQTVIEWGCGDGNQLKLAQYPYYVGYDVSQTAVERCRNIFSDDKTKEFIWSGADDFVSDKKGDLAISLDVIYHLVEDEVFELYMNRLFASSNKYVCIYSCNYNEDFALHVKCRKFTDYIDNNISGWELMQVIKNEYPYDEKNPNTTSWSDFYIYQRRIESGE